MGWYTPTAAPPDLGEDVVCSWTARTDGTHLLVPDGCVDVLWIAGVGIRVCGPETEAWKFTLPSGTAHLSRDCRRISSMTPKELLASEAPHWHGRATVLGHVRNIQSTGNIDTAESAA